MDGSIMVKTDSIRTFIMFYFKNLKEWQQTSFVILVNQIIFFTGLCFYYKLWYLPLISMYLCAFYWEVALHKYFAHTSFVAIPSRTPILCIMGFLVGQGSILSHSNVHRHHHKYADTPKDPHSPFYVPIWRIVTSILSNKCEDIFVRNLMKTSYRKYLIFENKWYWLMWIVLWITSYLISPKLLFFFASGCALWWYCIICLNIVPHSLILGTRPDSTKVATNSKLINFFIGVGNHHNHHADPTNYSDKRTNEFYFYEYPIKWFFMDRSK